MRFAEGNLCAPRLRNLRISRAVYKDSDLDVLVIVRGPVHRRFLAQEICRNLHGILTPVDIVVATEQDLQEHGQAIGSILLPALREGQVIYDRGQ